MTVHQLSAASADWLAVAKQRQTYHNIGYLLIALPLGLAHLLVLVVGFALVPASLAVGGLSVLSFRPDEALGIVGLTGMALLGLAVLPLILPVIAITRRLAHLEARLASNLLGHVVAPDLGDCRTAIGRSSPWNRVRARLTDLETVRGMAFLCIKLPLGFLSFVVVVGSVLVAIALMLAPLTYSLGTSALPMVDVRADSVTEAITCLALAPVAVLGALHAMNGVAWASREMAGLLLNPPRVVRAAWATVRA